jgi:Tol biopolymer transport system component
MSVYVTNANGSGERRVASWGQAYITCWGEALAWSPDGTRLAVARAGVLYTLDLKTGGMRRLTEPASGADLDPAWSPDGSRIAFAHAPGCGSICPLQPYIVNADGRGLRRLSRFYGELLCGGPLWSPDGRTIAFCASNKRDREGIGMHTLNKAIYAVNPDGSHLRLLVAAPPTGTNQLQALASWSPDGRHILYFRFPWNSSKGPQATALCVMNVNGAGRRVLYRARYGQILGAIWSPDGQRIAFSVLATFRSGLFVMNADGRHLHRLAVAGYDLAWQPIP